MNLKKALAIVLAIVFLSPLGLAPASVQATVIPFTVQFGGDGTGSFIYDDDNGGTNAGFTSFTLDFSPALGASFGNVSLSASGSSSLGPGGVFAPDLFSIFSVPSLDQAMIIGSPGFTSPIVLALLSGSWSGVPQPFSGGICNPPATGPGGYAFCTDAQTGSGVFQTTAVPTPSAGILFVTGLACLGWYSRRRRAV